ncbi:MAG TPA: M17 family peptidase N-terminal domain-containing protein, partial [Propionibacteriaceae bacterium]|nr:M17 family peptidase N-terminal domain-containing protein [Propionibacteriaceae bacterium]
MSAIPTLELVKQPSNKADAVIVGLVGDGPSLVGLTPDLEKAVAKAFSTSVLDLALDLGASSEASKVVVLPSLSGQRLVVVGLGVDADVTPEQVRRSTGAAVREVASRAKDAGLRVAVSLETTDPELVKAAAEGATLGAYTFAKVSGTAAKPGVTAVEVVSTDRGDARTAVDVAREIVGAVCTARDWVNAPANDLYPESFASSARDYFKGTKVDIEVLDENQLAKGGYGGILAVGNGSSRKPRLMRVDYHPRGAKFHLNLVGKGITFDTGGLNLKPADGMYTMKCDMAGAAAVLAATKAIASLGYAVHITTYAAM